MGDAEIPDRQDQNVAGHRRVAQGTVDQVRQCKDSLHAASRWRAIADTPGITCYKTFFLRH